MKAIQYAARGVNAFLSNSIGVSIARVHRSHASSNYDQRHEREALNSVRAIEKYNGAKLSRCLKGLADDYAIEVLGGKQYAPWLYVYTLIRGCFKEGWIPDNFFGGVVLPKVHKDIGTLLRLKTFSNIVLKTDAFPDLAYYVDGVFYNQNYEVTSLAVLRKIIHEKHAEVFIKKDGPGRGRGVAKLATKDIGEGTFSQMGNCVIQAPVQQHGFFERIISGSVAAVRITTVKELDGRISVRACYLSLGRKDMAWIQSDNSVRVSIVNGSGDLDTYGYTQDWIRWSCHPDTGVPFSNLRIPKFKEAAEICVKLHASVPHFTIIGWDIAISDDQRIKLLEWNGRHTGIKFSEATIGPCFIGLNWESFR